jgi:spermidine/putrescine transport system ATP-binding protein/putrescine transport system ATP-binding protein
VSKRFGSFTAVDDVSFDIRPNEFFALLGPSGCGKTTLLRMVAGLEIPSAGNISIDGEEMSAMPPNRRPINMVFQSYAVFPHMNVEDNVAYGLMVSGTPKAEIAPRVREALDMVQLPGLAARMPDQLSGGQRQRVALARALIKRPKVLLLDEPLSALDAKLREQMQLELMHLQQKVGVTFIIVTHDQDEALSMADRIAVMEGGQIRQIAAPDTLYENPKSRFVADFIGKVNLLDGQVTGISGGNVSIEITGAGRLAVPHEGAAEGKVSLAVRPEKLSIGKDEPAGGSPGTSISVKGRVTDWAYYGDTSHMYVQTAESGLRLAVNIQNDTRDTVNNIDIGDEVWVSWSASDTILLND